MTIKSLTSFFSRKMHSHSKTFFYNTAVEHNKPLSQHICVRPAYSITTIYPIPTSINTDSINSPYFHHIYNKKTRMTIILELYNNPGIYYDTLSYPESSSLSP